MTTTDYTYNFDCKHSAEQMFIKLLDVKQWWMGLFDERIKGKYKKLNDVFTFDAGGGLHHSKQQLVELVPNARIVWQVTESKLSFLKQTDEWTGTQICFDILSTGANTCTLRFTHVGLKKDIECYDSCSSAWSAYLHNLEKASN